MITKLPCPPQGQRMLCTPPLYVSLDLCQSKPVWRDVPLKLLGDECKRNTRWVSSKLRPASGGLAA